MKKVLMIIGGIVVGIIVLALVIIGIVSVTSEKMTCKSSIGNITLMYNDETLTGYTATGMTFDLDQQKAYATVVGIDAYLDEFADWFADNTNGVCVRK